LLPKARPCLSEDAAKNVVLATHVRVAYLGKDREMAKGTVKWFNTAKGYGFIQPEGGDKDIFVHITAVQDAGLRGLEDNQAIEYELIEGKDGRKSAGNLKLV